MYRAYTQNMIITDVLSRATVMPTFKVFFITLTSLADEGLILKIILASLADKGLYYPDKGLFS